jgi:lipase chaperone LimK
MIRRTWTKELVIEAIRDRHRSGLPLRKVWKEDRAFCCAAATHFGSWQKALAAAGFQPYRTTWSRKRIIDSIRAWHRKGVALTKVWKADPTLYAYAKRFFGTWTKALLAARFKPQRRRLCRQSVISAQGTPHDP